MRVLYIEPEATGHRFALYLRNFAVEAVSRGWEVILATTGAAKTHPSYRELERDGLLAGSVEFDLQPPPGTTAPLTIARRQVQAFVAYGRAAEEARRRFYVEHVVVPFLDDIRYPVAMLGTPFRTLPCTGVMLRIAHHHFAAGVSRHPGRRDRVEQMVFRRLLRTPGIERIGVIDESLFLPSVMRKLGNDGARLVLLPDPMQKFEPLDRHEARRRLSFPDHAFLVLLYGSLSRRKGVHDFVATLRQPGIPDGIVGVIAGRPDAETSSFLQSVQSDPLVTSGRLRLELGFLSDERSRDYFAASDVVWVAYRDFPFMSGVLVQAAGCGKRVLATDGGLIGWLTRRYGLGEVVAAQDPSSFAVALQHLASHQGTDASWDTDAMSFAAAHAPEHFGRALCDAVGAPRR